MEIERNIKLIFNGEDRCCSHKFIYKGYEGESIFDQYNYMYTVKYKDKVKSFGLDIDMCASMFEHQEYLDKLYAVVKSMY